MKISIHTMYYLPEFGSAPILMDELASFLAGKGHHVEVVTTIPRPPHHQKYKAYLYIRELNNGFSVKRYRTNFTVHHIGRLLAWTVYTGWTILNLLNIKKGDVLFLRLPPLQLGITGFLAKHLRKAKVMLSVQDIHPDLSIESGLLQNRMTINLAKRFEKWIYRNADEIVVISDGFQKNLEDKEVSPKKLSIIPNWVDTSYLRPYPKENDIARKFFMANKFVVMYSGTITLSSYQSLEKVLEAASLLDGEDDIRFFIIGEGLKKPDLVKKADKLGLTNTMFLPFQPYSHLPYLLSASDVLIVPLDKEKTQLSVPSKLYSYIAAGRPILGLTDDQSEVAKIIKTARCGLSVEPDNSTKIADAILALKNSGGKTEQLGKNARKYGVENFSKEQVLRMYEDLIRRMAETASL